VDYIGQMAYSPSEPAEIGLSQIGETPQARDGHRPRPSDSGVIPSRAPDQDQQGCPSERLCVL